MSSDGRNLPFYPTTVFTNSNFFVRSVNAGVIQQSCEDMRSATCSFAQVFSRLIIQEHQSNRNTDPSGNFDGNIGRRFDRWAHDRVILSANWHSWCADMIGHARLWVGERLELGAFIGCSPDNNGMNRSREARPAIPETKPTSVCVAAPRLSRTLSRFRLVALGHDRPILERARPMIGHARLILERAHGTCSHRRNRHRRHDWQIPAIDQPNCGPTPNRRGVDKNEPNYQQTNPC